MKTKHNCRLKVVPIAEIEVIDAQTFTVNGKCLTLDMNGRWTTKEALTPAESTAVYEHIYKNRKKPKKWI